MNVQPPKRVARRGVLRHPAPPEVVFPLLCPVRETEWAGGWDLLEVRSSSGLIEPGCVFTTREASGAEAVWVTTVHDPEAWRVEFVKVTPGETTARISIALRPLEAGAATSAEVVYEHTSLGPAGDRFVEAYSEASYEAFLAAWERELNDFLAAGGR